MRHATHRLASVDGVPYSWGANGNLLSDGVYTYTRSCQPPDQRCERRAGRKSAMRNGLGERLQQSVDGVTTTLTVDLVTGLGQVLEDEACTYLYGLGRIAQYDESGPQYFLGDALGSARQMVDEDGNVVLVKEYEPSPGDRRHEK